MNSKAILSIFGLLSFAAMPELNLQASEDDPRPNILFAFADDYGCYGQAYAEIESHTPWNQVAKMPTLDRISEEGALFRNAYVTSPQCTPSRSGLLSGLHFWQTGLAAVQSGIWDFTNPSFPMLLREAGYHVGYTSKVWSPGLPTDAPMGGTEYEYETAGTEFDQFSQNVYKRIERGRGIEAAKAALFGQVRANFENFLADRESGKPFMYWFGPRNPHRDWIRGSGKKLWEIDPDSLKDIMPPFLPDVPEVREDFADYLGENLAFDLSVDVLIRKLEEIGELENTIIVMSGDHGAPGFPYGKCNQYDFGTRVALAIRWGKMTKSGCVIDDFINLIDLAPTFLEAGGVEVPSKMTGRSIMPLLMSGKDGQIDPSRTSVVTGRERHVPQSRVDYLPYPQRAYRNKDFSYIINFKPDRWPGGDPKHISETETPAWEVLEKDVFYTLTDMDNGPTKAFIVTHRNDPAYAKYWNLSFAKRPKEELYDLRNDPNELVNLANDPAYAAIKAGLKANLMEVLRETNDPRVMADGSRFDKMPYTFRRWRSE